MWERRETLGAHVACISFAPPELLRAYRDKVCVHAPLYADPERAAYRAFGFGRGSVSRVWLDPRVIGRYAQLWMRGKRPERPAQDTLQLGGDVVVGADGRVAWVYRSVGPEDRPSVASIGAALARA